jgi:hypothetical protein
MQIVLAIFAVAGFLFLFYGTLGKKIQLGVQQFIFVLDPPEKWQRPIFVIIGILALVVVLRFLWIQSSPSTPAPAEVADRPTALSQAPTAELAQPTVLSISPTNIPVLQTSVPPTLVPPTPIPPIVVPSMPAAPSQSETSGCSSSIGVISVEKDWRRVVLEGDGRIWQDQITNGNAPYEVSFTAPCTGNMQRLFNGVNATLLLDGQVVASGGNGVSITLVPGGHYTVQGGSGNGGFSLEVVRS